jgi:hypothetical protein
MDIREGVEWIQLAQDRGLWWALVNIVKNLRVLAHGVNSPFLLVPMAARSKVQFLAAWLLGY